MFVIPAALLVAAILLASVAAIHHFSVDNREYRCHVKASKMRIDDKEFEQIVNQCAEHEIK